MLVTIDPGDPGHSVANPDITQISNGMDKLNQFLSLGPGAFARYLNTAEHYFIMNPSVFPRRSLSPMRPSVLGHVKRKCQLEDNEPPAKRFSSLLIQQARLVIIHVCFLSTNLSHLKENC